MRRLSLAALVAIATLLIGCGETTERATAKAGKEFYGVAPQDPTTAVDFARMELGQVGSYHVLLSWARVEERPGEYDWSSYDQLFAQLALHDIVPVTYVFGTPSHYAETQSHPPTSSAKALAAWEQFLRAAAVRYGPDGRFWEILAPISPAVEPKPIEIWEIWNEQNGPAFWAPKPSVKQYSKLLRSSAAAIRRVNPDAEIMTGGMFATPSSKTSIKSFRFLKRLFEKKATTKIVDHVGIHPYGPRIKDVREQMERTYRVMKRGGAGRSGTWVTEIGWGSDTGVRSRLTRPPTEQGKLLRKAYKLMLKQRNAWNVQGVLWYTWRDPAKSVGLCKWCASAGLVDPDLDPKPAWYQFTKLTGGEALPQP